MIHVRQFSLLGEGSQPQFDGRGATILADGEVCSAQARPHIDAGQVVVDLSEHTGSGPVQGIQHVLYGLGGVEANRVGFAAVFDLQAAVSIEIDTASVVRCGRHLTDRGRGNDSGPGVDFLVERIEPGRKGKGSCGTGSIDRVDHVLRLRIAIVDADHDLSGGRVVGDRFVAERNGWIVHETDRGAVEIGAVASGFEKDIVVVSGSANDRSRTCPQKAVELSRLSQNGIQILTFDRPQPDSQFREDSQFARRGTSTDLIDGKVAGNILVEANLEAGGRDFDFQRASGRRIVSNDLRHVANGCGPGNIDDARVRPVRDGYASGTDPFPATKIREPCFKRKNGIEIGGPANRFRDRAEHVASIDVGLKQKIDVGVA